MISKAKINMRVLFLHTALNGLTAEYKVHITLARCARSEQFDPYFIWQSPVQVDGFDAEQIRSNDFGRDMSIAPKPNRYRRAGMMMQSLPRALAFLFASVKQIKPDIIYTSQQSLDVRFASLLAAYFHIPHVIHIHYNVGPWLDKDIFQAIRKSSRLIAVSEYIRQNAILQGVSPSAIHTVINPAPVSTFQPDSARRSIRAEFHLDENTPLVLAAGRLDPGKGHLDLFAAFAQVIREIPEARLLICGASTMRDNYADRLKQRVDELQIQPYTIFAGQRGDIPAIMHSANVFCLPTELDPCPLVFLEAMASGMPVVAYYSGGVPEMVLHNQTGLLSYPGDVPTLALNLKKVLSDPGYARQLGESGKNRAMTEFAPEKITGRWLNVLKEMIR